MANETKNIININFLDAYHTKMKQWVEDEIDVKISGLEPTGGGGGSVIELETASKSAIVTYDGGLKTLYQYPISQIGTQITYSNESGATGSFLAIGNGLTSTLTGVSYDTIANDIASRVEVGSVVSLESGNNASYVSYNPTTNTMSYETTYKIINKCVCDVNSPMNNATRTSDNTARNGANDFVGFLYQESTGANPKVFQPKYVRQFIYGSIPYETGSMSNIVTYDETSNDMKRHTFSDVVTELLDHTNVNKGSCVTNYNKTMTDDEFSVFETMMEQGTDTNIGILCVTSTGASAKLLTLSQLRTLLSGPA